MEGEFFWADQSTEEGGASLLPRGQAEHAVIKRGTIFAWSHILFFHAKTHGGLSRMSPLYMLSIWRIGKGYRVKVTLGQPTVAYVHLEEERKAPNSRTNQNGF